MSQQLHQFNQDHANQQKDTSNLMIIHMLPPINIINGTTQGCSLSMILYTFYNTPLILTVSHKNKTSVGFVNDCMYLVIADSLLKAYTMIKNMIERQDSGFAWSTSWLCSRVPWVEASLYLSRYPLFGVWVQFPLRGCVISPSMVFSCMAYYMAQLAWIVFGHCILLDPAPNKHHKVQKNKNKKTWSSCIQTST